MARVNIGHAVADIVARYFGKDVKLSEAAERAGVSAATATNHNG
ncbi:hypothetical protein [Achromobacter agilis]|nr:hypothetical protein [Achromobacter agilis]